MGLTLRLSDNDSSVLNALFDSEASLQNSLSIDSNLFGAYPQSTLKEVQRRERDALLLVNDENPSQANVDSAIEILDDIIRTYPLHASAWNNRAQTRRIPFSFEALSKHPQELGKIVDDLEQAVSLASPHPPTQALSPMQAKVLASAHTHRGTLLWMASRSEPVAEAFACVKPLGEVDKNQFEELASREFALGGRYGNSTAKQLAVKTNPYAKLCGSIVKEALQKEIADYYQVSRREDRIAE